MHLLPHLIYLFLAVLGLCCCARLSLITATGGYALVAMLRLLCVVVSLVAERGPERAPTSVAVLHGVSCTVACEIFPDQGLNSCACFGRWILNHWTTREVLIIGFK